MITTGTTTHRAIVSNGVPAAWPSKDSNQLTAPRSQSGRWQCGHRRARALAGVGRTGVEIADDVTGAVRGRGSVGVDVVVDGEQVPADQRLHLPRLRREALCYISGVAGR